MSQMTVLLKQKVSVIVFLGLERDKLDNSSPILISLSVNVNATTSRTAQFVSKLKAELSVSFLLHAVCN